ncbi:MAG: single-stranded DNA-binding protein [Candidatus Omnitrophota bacterium]
MASLNKVFLIGNLTRDPELRYVPSGTAVTTFSIAVNRVFTQQNGERKEDVCFIRIVAWGKLAQSCGEYLNKGSSVFIEGRLQNRSWEAGDGTKRSTMEVIAQRVQFLDRVKQTSTGSNAEMAMDEDTEPMEPVSAPDETVPF